MAEAQQISVHNKFENFLKTETGDDLFAKAYKVNNVLQSGVLTGNEGLGLVAGDKLQGEYLIRNKSGEFRSVIMLGSNSYLNLSTHPKVMRAAQNALDKFGYGMGAVSNYVGITDIHKELESRIANFYGTDAAIVFPSGYGTNVGVISALCNEGDVIINDISNHASIFDGCRLSGADIKVYPHSDMKALERVLKKIPEEQTGRLIITDGVFSMDGNVAPMDKICDLAEKYDALVMVDESHSAGVVGATGHGVSEQYNTYGRVDIYTGTLGKAFGGALGGFTTGRKEIIDLLRQRSRPYLFSNSLAPGIIGASLEVFKMLKESNEIHDKLVDNVNYFRDKMTAAGFDIKPTQSAICAVMLYDAKLSQIYAARMQEEGIYVTGFYYPVVPKDQARIRVQISAGHEKEHLDKCIAAFIKVGKELGVLK